MSKIIRLTENQFGEMMAYHGSGADFDKFNHKKYLSTGAGSQSFGWGTYITNDEAVASGYAEASKDKYDLWTYIYNGLIRNGVRKKDAINMSNLKDKLEQIIMAYGDDEACVISYLNNHLEMYKELNRAKSVIEFKSMLYAMKQIKRKAAYLYEVDIPEDNGQNYIEWYEEIDENVKNIVSKTMKKLEKKFNFKASAGFWPSIEMQILDGEELYGLLEDALGSDKAASLFLMQCGIDGIKYPSGTRWNKPVGASEDAMNYVIFDANKVKIVNKTKV